MLQKRQIILAGSLKNLRNTNITNCSLVTEVHKPKTSCRYNETKKVKQVHSVIPNLKHKLLSSESTIRKLTYQNKPLKTEQQLNKNFSSENI